MNRALKPLCILIALFACASLVAACGAVSKSEYQKQVKKIMDRVEKDGNKVFSASEPKESDFKKAEKIMNEAADDLEDITPPDDVKTLHEHMVDDIRTLADAMPKFGAAMVKLRKNPQDQEKIINDLQKDQKKLEKATDRLDKTRKEFVKKGYTAFKDK
jgi:hypothetical protein